MILIPVGVAAVVSHFLTPTETTILTLMACLPAMSAIPIIQKKELEKTNAAWNEFLQHGFEEED